jgi:hypothetical protein
MVKRERRTKLVFAGLQDGRVEGYDLRSKRSAFSFSLKQSGQFASSSAAIDSIAFAPDSSMLATGARSGILRWWDMRSCGRGEGPPLCEFKRNGAGIESLAWVPAGWTRSSPQSTTTPEETELEERERRLREEDTRTVVTLGGESLARGLPHLVIGTTDGLPWRAGLTPDAKAVVVEEYVGYECGDGVRVVRWCVGGEEGAFSGVEFGALETMDWCGFTDIDVIWICGSLGKSAALAESINAGLCGRVEQAGSYETGFRSAPPSSI